MQRNSLHPDHVDINIDALLSARPPHLAESLLFWQQWLRDPAVPSAKRLFEALRPHEIPHHLLYHFACDGFQRILRQSRWIELPHYVLLQKLLDTLRRWIEGEQPLSSIHGLHQEIQRLQRSQHAESPAHRAFYLGLSMASADPVKAARHVCFWAIQEHDRLWLCECLASHLEDFLLLRQHFLRFLALRCAVLEGHLDFLQKSLESGLFAE